MLSRIKWAQLAEPARLRAVIAAAFSLAFALGVTTSAELPAWVNAAVVLVAAVVPLVQGESTRKVVTPISGTGLVNAPASVDEPVANGPVWVDPVQNVSQSTDPVELS